jgi:hypothetical protein
MSCSPHALQVAGFLVAGASVPLAIWTATAYRRLRTLRVTAPGAVIALAGGLLAAASLSLSGLITWTSSQTWAVAGPGLARTLAELSFATGGAGFAVPFALLLAGAGVPALMLRLTPWPWAWFGLAVAVAAVLSTFTLLTATLDVPLPIGVSGVSHGWQGPACCCPTTAGPCGTPGPPNTCRQRRHDGRGLSPSTGSPVQDLACRVRHGGHCVRGHRFMADGV